MPEIIVYLLEGRSIESKRELVKDITAAVVKTIGAPAEAVTVSLVETPKQRKAKAVCSLAICRAAEAGTVIRPAGHLNHFAEPTGAQNRVLNLS